MIEKEIATLGGGCFWCMEAILRQVKGVYSCVSGYSGGYTTDPVYEEVKTGHTGHAEVIQIEFNPKIITYEEILEIFFAVHDPTTINRQGGDIGTQYRSVIFYHTGSQKEIAKKMILKLNEENVFKNPIVTELTTFEIFYLAEAYHQDYFRKNPFTGYCNVVIRPKREKFMEKFSRMLDPGKRN